MTPVLNTAILREILDMLERIDPDARLLQMQNLCQNNGVWTVPEDEELARYRPVIYEIFLFGVPAIADDRRDLPANWMRAARNVLTGVPQPDAA